MQEQTAIELGTIYIDMLQNRYVILIPVVHCSGLWPRSGPMEIVLNIFGLVAMLYFIFIKRYDRKKMYRQSVNDPVQVNQDNYIPNVQIFQMFEKIQYDMENCTEFMKNVQSAVTDCYNKAEILYNERADTVSLLLETFKKMPHSKPQKFNEDCRSQSQRVPALEAVYIGIANLNEEIVSAARVQDKNIQKMSQKNRKMKAQLNNVLGELMIEKSLVNNLKSSTHHQLSLRKAEILDNNLVKKNEEIMQLKSRLVDYENYQIDHEDYMQIKRELKALKEGKKIYIDTVNAEREAHKNELEKLETEKIEVERKLETVTTSHSTLYKEHNTLQKKCNNFDQRMEEIQEMFEKNKEEWSTKEEDGERLIMLYKAELLTVKCKLKNKQDALKDAKEKWRMVENIYNPQA